MDKILIQLTINKEKYPELWEKLKSVKPRNRGAVIRNLALKGLLAFDNTESKGKEETNSDKQKKSIKLSSFDF